MRFITKIALGYLLLVPTSWAINIPKCLETTNQIYKDFKKYPDIVDEHLHWMRVIWLKNNLGDPQVTKNPSGQTEYRWQCTPNDFITTTMTSDGTTNYALLGTTQINGKNWHFGINFDASTSFEGIETKTTAITVPPQQMSPAELNTPITTPPPAATHAESQPTNNPPAMNSEAAEKFTQSMEDATNQLLEKAVPEYNAKLGATVKNAKELQTDMNERIKSFGDKFETCSPGSYIYPAMFLNLIYVNTTIKEKQDDFCITETSYTLRNGDIFMICKIPMTELPALKESFTQISEASLSAATKGANDTQGSILKKYCTSKITVNEKKTP